MTRYFVTGGSGFLGRRVLARLLAQDGAEITVLVRGGSLPKLSAALERIDGGDRIVTAVGDLTDDGLGLTDGSALGPFDHVIHLGGIHDFDADEAAVRPVNVDGTARVAEFAAAHGAVLHHVSSTFVAGDHDGDFTEDDFDLGQDFPTPYHRSRFDAERIVRDTEGLRWRIYRPSSIVGDSATGEADRIDGLYHFFPSLTEIGQLPLILPVPVLDIGDVNVVPVDYVADALVALLPHRPDETGLVFHLADPVRRTVTELFNTLAPVLGAPRGFGVMPRIAARAMMAATGHNPLRPGRDLLVQQLGIPPVLLDVVSVPVHISATATVEVLERLGVSLPDFGTYLPTVWSYWYRHLDPGRHRRTDPRGPLVSKNIVITGGSSGIGKATARMCITRGANVILVSHEPEQLSAVAEELNAEVPKPGLPLGRACAYVADITDESLVRTLVKSIIAEHDHIDVLVNNAGRSIRRSSVNALDRAHDYQRMMAVNYFGAVYLTLSVLPHMIERQSGHIVNVSDVLVQSRGARFGAYAASKAALEAFADATAAETLSDHVTFTNVRLPLTRTRMIAPTRAYESRRGIWGVDKAAHRVLKAIVERPKQVTSLVGDLADLGHRTAPRLTNRIKHQEYLWFGESEAALGMSTDVG
ncbi:putative oxidoreductase [Gordonia hirsuta DSM 44140 = NBRC 16056]|uniref:Putative oxidoreductase n=1 Tax=Gordonia hirsuta DSM 44140 = NBRC 16056 TaxID=1121927 RepID=L7L9D4_9ACTN|nr:SDR family oxidoreductase [Gordonia hirsuta]GAC56662.1 putative oxidoreductase [Gordonia hirsuta DSM 44140 = NBRC 16056]